jgi:hypothetical protein
MTLLLALPLVRINLGYGVGGPPERIGSLMERGSAMA